MKKFQYREFIITFEHCSHDDGKCIMPNGSIVNTLTGEKGGALAVNAPCRNDRDADRLVREEAIKRIRTDNWRA